MLSGSENVRDDYITYRDLSYLCKTNVFSNLRSRFLKSVRSMRTKIKTSCSSVEMIHNGKQSVSCELFPECAPGSFLFFPILFRVMIDPSRKRPLGPRQMRSHGSKVASPRAQGQIPQGGEEILHFLFQKTVAVLRVLPCALRVSEFYLQHALLLPLLLHLLFQTFHLGTQSSAGLLQSVGSRAQTEKVTDIFLLGRTTWNYTIWVFLLDVCAQINANFVF